MSELKYKRILLKLSGEALAGPSGFGIDVAEAESIASRIKEVYAMGVEVAVVLGLDPDAPGCLQGDAQQQRGTCSR